MPLDKNKHKYQVSHEFQQWWGTVCTAPHEALMEKMLACKAWELQQQKLDKAYDIIERMLNLHPYVDIDEEVKALKGINHDTKN